MVPEMSQNNNQKGGLYGIVFPEDTRKVTKHDFRQLLENSNISEKCDDLVFQANVGICANASSHHFAKVTELILNGQRYLIGFYGNIWLRSIGYLHDKNVHEYLSNLVHLYIQKGTDFLLEIEGDFSLVLWDGERQKLILATDPCRICPLFYYFNQETLFFASRLAALGDFAHKSSFSVNPYSVINFVGSSYIPTPATIFHEANKIPPGHVLTLQKKSLEIRPYWDLDFTQESQAPPLELKLELHRVFRQSIEKQVSENRNFLEVGTFLSGGLDSSTVTGVLTQITGEAVKAFTIGFSHEQYNEVDYARCAAHAFGSKHYEYEVTPLDTFEVIPHLLSYFDEPFGNASAIPTYFCAKLAKEHGVQVLLAGDGGDELFAGNERYVTQKIFDYYQVFPKWFRQVLIEPCVSVLERRVPNSLFRRGQKYIQRANIPYPERLSSWGIFEILPPDQLFHPDLIEVLISFQADKDLFRHYAHARANTELDRQLYVDLKMAISDNDLIKVTGMTAAAGVNARFPFLDRSVMEFAATIPASLKMNGRQLRSFFKWAYADLLPKDILKKKKQGFGLPISYWLKTYKPLNEMMHEVVLGTRMLNRHLFRPETLKELVRSHESDRTPFFGTILWNIMMLEMWLRQYEDRNTQKKNS